MFLLVACTVVARIRGHYYYNGDHVAWPSSFPLKSNVNNNNSGRYVPVWSSAVSSSSVAISKPDDRMNQLTLYYSFLFLSKAVNIVERAVI